MQQQAAGRAANVEDKRKAGREGGRAGDVEDKRKAGRAGDVDVKRAARRLSGLTRSAAARRLHGHNDAATIAATTNISRFSSVRDRVEKANGMTVIKAIELNIYTLRTLRSDESAGYIALNAHPTGSRTSPCATRTETTSVALELPWTVTTISS